MNEQLHLALQRDAHGRLVLRLADGSEHVGVQPVRAFPLSEPDGALSLVGTDGREVLWVERPAELAHDVRSLIHEELARREFAPVIERLIEVSTFSTPSTFAHTGATTCAAAASVVRISRRRAASPSPCRW